VSRTRAAAKKKLKGRPSGTGPRTCAGRGSASEVRAFVESLRSGDEFTIKDCAHALGYATHETPSGVKLALHRLVKSGVLTQAKNGLFEVSDMPGDQGGGAEAKLWRVLRAHSGRGPVTTQELAALAEVKKGHARDCLKRWVLAGLLIRVAQGKYRMTAEGMAVGPSPPPDSKKRDQVRAIRKQRLEKAALNKLDRAAGLIYEARMQIAEGSE